MKKLLTFALLLACAAEAGAGDYEKLAGKLAEGLKDRPQAKVAVLELPYAGGKSSEGPVVVQERLTTALAAEKNITLIERGQLQKVLAELKLQAGGAMGADSVKQVGQLLGADAVVTGTLNDIGKDNCEINARVVETESGKILAAAAVKTRRTWKDAAPGKDPGPGKPPADHGGRPLVQVALLLDTSNSMDGLISQARAQLWKVINELVVAEKDGGAPVIEVALYDYGNTRNSREENWVRQVLPFTRDLDRVSQELFALRTSGGEEHAGAVIRRAVRDLAWSKKTDVYKAVFIAGNEPFTQGQVDFAEAAAEAKARGIFLNTIYCGPRQQGVAQQWLAGAQAGDGDYTNIDQNLGASSYYVQAPQDARLAELSSQLDRTAVAYGASGRARGMAQAKMSESLAAAAPAAAAERAAFKARASFAAEADAEWDVVSALESGSVKRDEIKKDQLPEELQKLDPAALDKHLDAQLEERRRAKAEIVRLQEERKAYIAAEEKKRGQNQSLDKAMIDTIRKQAAARGYRFK